VFATDICDCFLWIIWT